MNDWMNCWEEQCTRLHFRTASFCNERSGHFDAFDQVRPASLGSWDAFARALPDSNEICCMLNHQRRLTLLRPSAAPTATQLRVVLTLHVLLLQGVATSRFRLPPRHLTPTPPTTPAYLGAASCWRCQTAPHPCQRQTISGLPAPALRTCPTQATRTTRAATREARHACRLARSACWRPRGT